MDQLEKSKKLRDVLTSNMKDIVYDYLAGIDKWSDEVNREVEEMLKGIGDIVNSVTTMVAYGLHDEAKKTLLHVQDAIAARVATTLLSLADQQRRAVTNAIIATVKVAIGVATAIA